MNQDSLSNQISGLLECLMSDLDAKVDLRPVLHEAISALSKIEQRLDAAQVEENDQKPRRKHPCAFQFAVLRAITDDAVLPIDIRKHIELQFNDKPTVQTTATRMNMMKRDRWIARDGRNWLITELGQVQLNVHLEEYAAKPTGPRQIADVSNDRLRELIQDCLKSGTKSPKDIVCSIEQMAGGTVKATRIHKAVYELKIKGLIRHDTSGYSA